MKKFWLSWYAPDEQPFELNSPWWITGYYGDEDDKTSGTTIVAAIVAPHGAAAKDIVRASYDLSTHGNAIKFRFCEECSKAWSPFDNSRFPRADWMQWPNS